MGPQGPTIGNAQLIRQKDFFFTETKLVYCLNWKTLKCNSLVQKIYLFLQSETSHCKNSLALGLRDPSSIFLATTFTRKMSRSSDFMYFPYIILENIWYHHFTWSGSNSQEIVNFVPLMGPWGPELNWNKFTISCEFNPLQVK